MTEQQLTQAGENWREQIIYHRELLEKMQTELVEAEAELADWLAAINAFEFKLRAGVGHLVARLSKLEAEIKEYRRQLRWRADDWGDMSDGGRSRWSMRDVEDVAESPGAAAGDFRYHAEPPMPPQELDAQTGVELKKLYRQLARRFHPDMGVDEADRAYRTQIMMAINAAYAAGDLAKLQALALEPDAADPLAHAQTDEQILAVLQRELARLRRRLEEIRQELTRLGRHKSTTLMRRAQQAEAEGRDWLAEMVRDLREKIAQRMVERDVLQSQMETMESAESDLHGDDFADAVWDLTLEHAFDEDPDIGVEDWVNRRRDRFEWDEDLLDDSD